MVALSDLYNKYIDESSINLAFINNADLENSVTNKVPFYCHLDYKIRKTTNENHFHEPTYLMQCSICHGEYYSSRGHKDIDCKKNLFNDKVTHFHETQLNNRPIKCISDKILLYLRYGLDVIEKDLNLFDINPSKDNSKYDCINYCLELYKSIRGRDEYVIRNPKCVACAILCIGIIKTNVVEYSPKIITTIGNIFNLTLSGVKNNMKFIRQNEGIEL